MHFENVISTCLQLLINVKYFAICITGYMQD